ncbi:hypothetical protein JX266_006495 [Neoarthrinium moseri]|nr:hypothetical protein JX266_006495 [Neoarthrinium moseri]
MGQHPARAQNMSSYQSLPPEERGDNKMEPMMNLPAPPVPKKSTVEPKTTTTFDKASGLPPKPDNYDMKRPAGQ